MLIKIVVQTREAQIPARYGDDAVEIPGARQLLASLGAEEPRVPWAIVTSATSGAYSVVWCGVVVRGD